MYTSCVLERLLISLSVSTDATIVRESTSDSLMAMTAAH